MSSCTIISPIQSYCSMLRLLHSASMSVGGDVGSIKTKPISIDCSLNAPRRGTWWSGSKGATRWGSRADQQTIVGTVGDIVAKAEAAHLEPPTVIVVGEVVRLRGLLNWFETKPLFGKRVVLTRAQEQAREFSQLLAAYGAEPVEVPTIQIVPQASWQAINDAVTGFSTYQCVIFTSVNGVMPFMDR